MGTGRCICGKRTKRKKDGDMGKTCGSRTCSGKLSKQHMLAVLKSSPDYFAISIAPRDYVPFPNDR